MAHTSNFRDVIKLTDDMEQIADFENMSITTNTTDFTISHSTHYEHNETFPHSSHYEHNETLRTTDDHEDVTVVKRKLIMETSKDSAPTRSRLRSGHQYKTPHDYASANENEYLEHEVQMYREPVLCEKLQYARSSYPIRDGLLRSPLHDDRWVSGHEVDCHYHSTGSRHKHQHNKRKNKDLMYARDSYPSRVGLRRKPLHSRKMVLKDLQLSAVPIVRSEKLTKRYDLRWLILSFFILCLIILFVVWLKDNTAKYLYKFY